MLGLRHFKGSAIDLFQGDLTEFVCDGMVNAANEGLKGGGGVDGAIHRAAGPSLLEACRPLAPCPTGQAVITQAMNLPCSHVIHAVGPQWQGGGFREAERLASAYRWSFRLAAQQGLSHLALPALSTGAYKYPLDAAATIALETLRDWLERPEGKAPRRFTFVLFDRSAYQAFQKALFEAFPEQQED